MGEPIAVFETGIALYVMMALVFFLVGGLLALDGIAGLFEGARGNKGALPNLKMASAGIMSLALAAIALRKSWQRPRLRVFAFQHGLACVERGSLEIVRWEDVNRVVRVDESNRFSSSRAPGDGIFQVILVRRDGRVFAFNETLRWFAVCRFVERMLTVVQTLRLQKRPVLHYLVATVQAHRASLPTTSLLSNQ